MSHKSAFHGTITHNHPEKVVHHMSAKLHGIIAVHAAVNSEKITSGLLYTGDKLWLLGAIIKYETSNNIMNPVISSPEASQAEV